MWGSIGDSETMTCAEGRRLTKLSQACTPINKKIKKKFFLKKVLLSKNYQRKKGNVQ